MSSEAVQKSSLQLPCQHALATPSEHEKVKGKVLDVIMDVVTEALPVQSVQYRVTGSIRDGTSSTSHAAFAKLQRLPAKCALVDFAFLRAAERTT